MSSILDSLSTAVFGEEGDDPSCLTDPVTASLYEAPAKGLGISANFTPWEARDALRNNCLALLGPTHFNRKDKPVLTHKYALLAYHLCMKTLKIKKAQQLKALMEDEPRFFQGGASDMLQILRPVPCEGVAMHPHVRAGAMLHVIYDDYALCQEAGEPMPHQQYVIQISYCGRQHFIRRRYSEFRALHDRLSKELLVVPGFPNGDASYKIGLGDYAARGRALCRYAGRVHASLAARGVFSPRLLAFLEVDAARVPAARAELVLRSTSTSRRTSRGETASSSTCDQQRRSLVRPRVARSASASRGRESRGRAPAAGARPRRCTSRKTAASRSC